MLLDDRVLGANATSSTRDQWAREVWPQVEVLWAFLILLHFAGLIPIDPVILHVLSIVSKSMLDRASVTQPEF